MRTQADLEARRRPYGSKVGREIGPAGTLARLAMAGAALAVGALGDAFTTWNVAFGLLGLPVVALLTLRIPSSFDEGIEADCCEAAHTARPSNDRWLYEWILLGAVTAAVIAVSLVTPVTEGSVWVWLSLSFLLAAVEGHTGCEMVTLPNLLTRKRYRVPCLSFVSVDRWEAGHLMAQSSPPRTASSSR